MTYFAALYILVTITMLVSLWHTVFRDRFRKLSLVLGICWGIIYLTSLVMWDLGVKL